MNEFVSISELMQSRKDKINSKDITKRFLFSLFDSSVMCQIAERVCTFRSLIDRRREIVGGRRGEGGEVGKNIRRGERVEKRENFNRGGLA